MQPTYKHSKQRDALIKIITSRYDHPSADMLYTDLRKDIPNISLGTVYRNLALLENQKIISKIAVVNGIDRYDGNTKPHYHFVCQKCYSVIDIDMPVISSINQTAEKYCNANITNHSVIFSGICSNCKSDI